MSGVGDEPEVTGAKTTRMTHFGGEYAVFAFVGFSGKPLIVPQRGLPVTLAQAGPLLPSRRPLVGARPDTAGVRPRRRGWTRRFEGIHEWPLLC